MKVGNKANIIKVIELPYNRHDVIGLWVYKCVLISVELQYNKHNIKFKLSDDLHKEKRRESR